MDGILGLLGIPLSSPVQKANAILGGEAQLLKAFPSYYTKTSLSSCFWAVNKLNQVFLGAGQVIWLELVEEELSETMTALSVFLECERLLEFRRSDAEVSVLQFLLKYSASVKVWKMHPKDIVISSTSALLFLYCHESILRRCTASFPTVIRELEATWRSKMAPGPISPCALPYHIRQPPAGE